MKKLFFLFSLLAVIFTSCQKEQNEVMEENNQEIARLEKQYGVTFEEVTGEIDSSSGIFIPFDDLKQLLEGNSNPLSRGAIYMGEVKGKGVYRGFKLTFDFLKVPLDKYYFNVELSFEDIPPKEPIYVGNSLFCGLSALFLKSVSDEEIISTILQDKKWGYGSNEFSATADARIRTWIGGKLYYIGSKILINLRFMAQTAYPSRSFVAYLKLEYTF